MLYNSSHFLQHLLFQYSYDGIKLHCVYLLRFFIQSSIHKQNYVKLKKPTAQPRKDSVGGIDSPQNDRKCLPTAHKTGD